MSSLNGKNKKKYDEGNPPNKNPHTETSRAQLRLQQSTSSARFLLQSLNETQEDQALDSSSCQLDGTLPASGQQASLNLNSLIRNTISGSDLVPVGSKETTACVATATLCSTFEQKLLGQRSNEKRQQKQNEIERRLRAEFADDSISSTDFQTTTTTEAASEHKYTRPGSQKNFEQQENKTSCLCGQDSQSESQRLCSRRRDSSSSDYSSCSKESRKKEVGDRKGHCCSSSSLRKQTLVKVSGEEMTSNNQSIRLIPVYFIAELLGTFLLVLIGDGAIAAYVMTKRQVDVFSACLAFGVGAMIASFASAKLSGAHINPAASLAFALDGKLKWRLLPVYMLAQYIGGFLAALVLFLNYREAIQSLDAGQRSAFGNSNSTGSVFATYPASYVTIWGALLDQVVGTAVLLFSLSAVTDRSNHGLEEKHQPLIVALVIGLICLAFSPNCGAIFNPARDLAPRLVTALFGYPAVWAPLQGTYWFLAGVLGPHVGAIIGLFGYNYTIGFALKIQRRHLREQSLELQQQDQNNGQYSSIDLDKRQHFSGAIKHKH